MERYSVTTISHVIKIIMKEVNLNLERFLFEDIDGFVDKFLEEYENRENEKDFCGVSIVAHYGIMIDILNYLIDTTCFKLCDIELEMPESCGYEDEYVLSVGTDGKIWCQRAKYDEKYIHLEKDVTFVHSNVNSKFIVKNKNECMIEFSFASEEECECDSNCDECKSNGVTTISDDNMHGFTVTRSDENNHYSYSFYSTDEKLVEEMARLFK